MPHLARPRFLAAAAIAAGLLGVASAAQAHTDVFFSVGVPIVNPAPVYVQPQPVYVQPDPVYMAPQPAYVAPPVYVAPPTRVVVRPAWGYDRDWRRAQWHREEWRRHHEREYRRHWE
jgi:hypothetical protein